MTTVVLFHSVLGVRPGVLDQTVRYVEAGGGTLEVFDYPGSGHLFTDPTLPAEYDPVATETFWGRVLPFIRACGS
jgi:dienelactone hydrolase